MASKRSIAADMIPIGAYKKSISVHKRSIATSKQSIAAYREIFGGR